METSSLRKILEIEKARGFGDTTVIGGMDKFMRNWADQASVSISDKKTLTRFSKLRNPKYKEKTPEQRSKWAQDILAFLAELEHTPAVNIKPSAAPSKPRRATVPKQPVTTFDTAVESPVSVINGVGEAIYSITSPTVMSIIRI
jgi:ATP-dependent DNA helicase RecG